MLRTTYLAENRKSIRVIEDNSIGVMNSASLPKATVGPNGIGTALT